MSDQNEINIDDFRVLFTQSDSNHYYLTSFSINNNNIATSEAIAGTYICQGANENGVRRVNVTINVEGLKLIEVYNYVKSCDFNVSFSIIIVPGLNNFSQVYIRATADLDNLFQIPNRELQFAFVESLVSKICNFARLND